MSEEDDIFMKIMESNFAEDISLDDFFINQIIQYRPVLRYGEFIPVQIDTFAVGRYKGATLENEPNIDWYPVEFFRFEDAIDYINDLQDGDDSSYIIFDEAENVTEIDNFDTVSDLCETLNEVMGHHEWLNDEDEV